MIFAQGVDAGPGGSSFAIVAAGFLVCAFVTWGVYWGYRKIVTPRYPRFNRAVGWAAWALVVIFAIVVLVWWQASRSWNQFFLFFPMCLGIGASILAVGVCAACRLLNGLTRRQNGTTYVPNPTLGGGLAIAAVAMLATLGLLCLGMVMPNVWMGVIVGIICPVGMSSAATASMLPTKFWKGALVTLLSCAISALPATLVYVPLYWFSQSA